VWSDLLSQSIWGLSVGFQGAPGGSAPLARVAQSGRPFLHLHGMTGWMRVWLDVGRVICGECWVSLAARPIIYLPYQPSTPPQFNLMTKGIYPLPQNPTILPSFLLQPHARTPIPTYTHTNNCLDPARLEEATPS